MRQVIVVDDQDHALKQVIFEFPKINKDDIVFRHFSSMKAYRMEKLDSVFMLFLDFFLSIDREYGSSLIPEISCENLICFSSKKEMSDHMLKTAQEVKTNKIRNAYSVQKIKDRIENENLRIVLKGIIENEP